MKIVHAVLSYYRAFTLQAALSAPQDNIYDVISEVSWGQILVDARTLILPRLYDLQPYKLLLANYL